MEFQLQKSGGRHQSMTGVPSGNLRTYQDKLQWKEDSHLGFPLDLENLEKWVNTRKTWKKSRKYHGILSVWKSLFFIDTLPETCLIISPFVWEVPFASAASSPPNHGYHIAPSLKFITRQTMSRYSAHHWVRCIMHADLYAWSMFSEFMRSGHKSQALSFIAALFQFHCPQKRTQKRKWFCFKLSVQTIFMAKSLLLSSLKYLYPFEALPALTVSIP